MLTDTLVDTVREAGGENLLFDARNARGIIGDAARVPEVCRRLSNAGFTRFINLTALHTAVDPDEYALLLTLRHPGQNYAALTLKWKWSGGAGGPGDASVPARDPEPAGTEARPPKSASNGAIEADNEAGGAGRSGGQPQRTGPAAHPTLSHIWPAAGVAEREAFELCGIPFDGNDNLSPLYLDEAFNGHPLRLDFVDESEQQPSYAQALLKQRVEQGMLDALMEAGELSSPDPEHSSGLPASGGDPA